MSGAGHFTTLDGHTVMFSGKSAHEYDGVATYRGSQENRLLLDVLQHSQQQSNLCHVRPAIFCPDHSSHVGSPFRDYWREIFLQAGCPSCHPTNSVEALNQQECEWVEWKRIHTCWVGARDKQLCSVTETYVTHQSNGVDHESNGMEDDK